MSWETRYGRGSYYTRSRRKNGRIIREYVGTGSFALVIAHLDAVERQQHQVKLAHWQQQKNQAESLDSDMRKLCYLTDMVAHTILQIAGFHNHKGQWRKCMIQKNPKSSITETDRLETVFDRIVKNDKNAIPEFRQILQQFPWLVDMAGNMAKIAEESLVKAITGGELGFSEPLAAKLEVLRNELAGPQPSPIEKLLIERVVACWLQVYHADAIAAQAENSTFVQNSYNLRLQDRAHRRFLSAIKTLATVRRLALPTLIAVNVSAGTVETKETESVPVLHRWQLPIETNAAAQG